MCLNFGNENMLSKPDTVLLYPSELVLAKVYLNPLLNLLLTAELLLSYFTTNNNLHWCHLTRCHLQTLVDLPTTGKVPKPDRSDLANCRLGLLSVLQKTNENKPVMQVFSLFCFWLLLFFFTIIACQVSLTKRIFVKAYFDYLYKKKVSGSWYATFLLTMLSSLSLYL